MELKDLFTCPVEEISSEGLSQLQLIITDELTNRRTRARENAWDKLVKDIKDYIATFGDIEIYDSDDDITFCLTALEDYSTNGEIKLNFE